MKYRVKFHITNLDKEELRDFKINLVTSNNILEFDSDDVPRLPSKSEKIKISDRSFEIENSDIEYISENGETINIFNFYIFDIKKKMENDINHKMASFMKNKKYISGNNSNYFSKAEMERYRNIY